MWVAGILLGVIAVIALLLAPPTAAVGLTASNSQRAPQLSESRPRQLRVLVIGGTSGIGLATTRLALERGHQVVVMSRRGRIEPALSPAPTVVQGDIRDAASVATAMRDVDAVVISISTPPGSEPVTVFSDGVRNVLSALPSEKTVRVLFVSGIGAGDSRGRGGFGYDRLLQPLMLAENYADKDRAEAVLRGSAADWMIVRPGFLTDDPVEARYHVVSDLQGVRSGSLSRADVAHYLVASLESGAGSRDTVLLTN